MPTSERIDRIASVVAARQQGAVVFEDIHDPHNVQAALRSCDAFGFQHIHLIFTVAPPYDPTAIGKSSSSSANKWLDFTMHHTTGDCLDSLKQQGYQLIATTPTPQAESLPTTQIHQPQIALLFGNERTGLSDTALQLADRAITIPMTGMVQSLNLSVTVAIFLYEITRQRLALGIEAYRLPAEQQAHLRRDFLQR